MRNWLLVALTFSACLPLNGCRDQSSRDHQVPVVLYTSVDDPFVRPLIQQFQHETGITVNLVTDAEASKTTGLAEKLLAEKDHPRADVYWGNEPFHTINLAEAGAFAQYQSPSSADIPDRWRDKSGFYAPIGLRARMIAVSTRPENRSLVANVKSVRDLLDPKLKGRSGISNPGFGTASGQVAAFYLLWGDGATNAFLRSLRSNGVLLLGGNSAVADQVAAGTLLAGLTDNDDIANAKADGQPIEAVLPDQDADGTLLIPTTIALVRNGPNSDGARKLMDFLLTAAVEKQLIAAHFLAYSVRGPQSQVKSMNVDYVLVAHRMHNAVEASLEILQDRTRNADRQLPIGN